MNVNDRAHWTAVQDLVSLHPDVARGIAARWADKMPKGTSRSLTLWQFSRIEDYDWNAALLLDVRSTLHDMIREYADDDYVSLADILTLAELCRFVVKRIHAHYEG